MDSENSPVVGKFGWDGKGRGRKYTISFCTPCLTRDGERITCRSSSRYTHTRARTSFIGPHLNSWPGARLKAMHSKRPERAQNATECVGILLLLLLGGGRRSREGYGDGPGNELSKQTRARVSIIRVNIRKTLFYLAATVR